ncbi:MAG TPA: S41 family peptidase [Candidatus Saccharimonadales bacterium]|nr:S41 family peptidase [Candidatus Saccharimonadales bacterium]
MDNHQSAPERQRRFRPVLKAFVIVFGALVFFGAGVAVGRGDIHIDNLSYSPSGAKASTFDYSSVDELYSLLNKNFDGSLNKGDLLNGIKTGLVSAAGDPYTEYFSPKDAKDFEQALSGSFTGIGAELGSDQDNNIVIVSPLSGYPAAKAGLQPKDIISAVNGRITTGMRLDAVVRQIRGPADTKVKLTIIRGSGQPFDVTITRAKIKVPSAEHKVDGQIGYLKVSQFSDDTVGLVRQAAKDFKAKSVKGIVLDLRSDPGGYLDSAVDIAGMWLPKGKTVVSERRGGEVLSTRTSGGSGEFQGLPTVVLIDGGSASASEILAGALRDNQAATLVGAKSFGKGSVQEVLHLGDGSELKVTIARWYTPAGKNIDKQGIKPDTEVKAVQTSAGSDKDNQKDKAYELLRAKL